MREPCDVVHARLAVEPDDDVESFRARGLHPAWQMELAEEVAQGERGRPEHLRLVFVRRIEIEHTDVRVIQLRRARRPHVLGDRVLVRHPEQRPRVGDERMVDDPILLRNLDPFEPRRKSARYVLLPEPFPADAGGISLHRDRPPADVRQHDRRDRLVIRRELALGDPVVGKQNLFRMRDHPISLTTSRAALSVRTPRRRG